MQRYSWDRMSWEAVTGEISRKVINGASVTVAQIDLKQGAIVPEHAHPNEQVTIVLRGTLRFRIGDEEHVLHPGDVLVTPSNAPHRVVAVEDSLAIDIFSPVRQDWLDHTDDYFHRKDV
jgi:quercetin dioxygenase-like cupin family protein